MYILSQDFRKGVIGSRIHPQRGGQSFIGKSPEQEKTIKQEVAIFKGRNSKGRRMFWL